MQKKHITIIAAVLTLLGASSCSSDFLHVTPTTEIPEDEYYDDYETLLKGLMAAYAPLQWPDFVFGNYAYVCCDYICSHFEREINDFL